MTFDRSLLPTVLAVSLGLLPVAALPGADVTAAAPPLPADSLPIETAGVPDGRVVSDLEQVLDAIAPHRVVFVGENHDRYADHLNQLKVIEGLRRRGKDLAIGVEFFQQPYQAALDDYIAGVIEEPEFLRRSQYFDRWRFDYRLYRPILSYAREHRIPVIALNLESELTRRVGEVGIAGLTDAQRARLPDRIDRSDPAYEARIKGVFAQHPGADKKSFEHFIEVQLLWDEGMAERAAGYLRANPDRTLVVLAGGGHIEYGQGIPQRLLRRVQVTSTTLLNVGDQELDPAAADYLLDPQPVELPPGGLLGVQLAEHGEGRGAQVQGFGAGSGAKAAGLQDGDFIVRIGEQQIEGYADIRIALLDRQPGERLPVEVRRKGGGGEDERLRFEVELH
ncbi:ChaN family lipoprotein [uncultured Thiodictyon sp.]|uniref:ChaN family lipoprotein n=1 Tax=uncultured Thiodictyon sp. TaxID=1846217 RepID=UPI0025D05990|nr:ChaN family lipoprotein [uncultured Thiodictyon sp.]